MYMAKKVGRSSQRNTAAEKKTVLFFIQKSCQNQFVSFWWMSKIGAKQATRILSSMWNECSLYVCVDGWLDAAAHG